MQAFRDLTVNQMLALFGFIVVVVIVAAILFGIMQQDDDPFLVPTPTVDIILPNSNATAPGN